MQVANDAYYTLSSYVGKSTGIGHYLVGPYHNRSDGVHHPHTPHRHDYYELIWIREGQGRLKCGTSEWDFRAGTLFFSAPGRLHCWSPETQLVGDLLGFDEEFFAADADYTSLLSRLWFLHDARCPLVAFEGDSFQEMDRLFAQLRQTADGPPLAGREDILRGYISIVLNRLRQKLDGSQADEVEMRSMAWRFRSCLETHFPRLLKVSDYAALIKTSRDRLNAALRQETGRTASDLIHDRLRVEAKRQLTYSSRSISEIAYTLNFQDPSYFCRFFRQREGLTPKEFRQQTQAHLKAA